MDRARGRVYEHDEVTYRINGAAIAVHRELGPGLFESVYENALCVEFRKRNIRFERQKRFYVEYQCEPVGHLVADLVVEDEVIVDLKAAKLKTGLLINFNVKLLKTGIKRISV